LAGDYEYGENGRGDGEVKYFLEIDRESASPGRMPTRDIREAASSFSITEALSCGAERVHLVDLCLWIPLPVARMHK
jgi:hypothetical protein